MKKLRIFIDSSVISLLDQKDSPERMDYSHRLWEKIKDGEFDVVITWVTKFLTLLFRLRERSEAIQKGHWTASRSALAETGVLRIK